MAAATVQGAGEEGIVCSLKYFALMKENLQEEIGEKMYDISSSYDILNVISNKMIFGFSKKIRKVKIQ
jgi:hypothetical protein